MSRTGSTTQRESIKQFLKAGNSITALEALSLFGAYRLAAHIHVLRERHGMLIVTTMSKDYTGRPYARYSLPACELPVSTTKMVPHHFNNGKLVPINTNEAVHYAH